MILTVPHDAELYPTLGLQVCDFMEQNLVFGPGDLKGEPLVLDDERRGLIYRMYEVFPQGHPHAGRRRFRRVGISLRKGKAKTELAALIAACELHPEAPVRCTGFTASGEPIGGPVTDPYIPMVAVSEEQSEELAYSALKTILEHSTLADDFDIGIERILRKKGDGKAVSLSTNPNARDGARTTFAISDETHRWTLPRLRDAHKVMLANLPKRRMADPWSLEITTAPEPGSGSVAEATMEYAKAVEQGRVTDTTLFYYHLQASDHHDLTTKEGARAAVIEASGSAAAWSDIDGIVALLDDPSYDRAYWERVWCNRLVKGTQQAFSVEQWKSLAVTASPVKPGDVIVLGFDGAMFHDSTALVATHLKTGYQWVVGLWERPYGAATWKVPVDEVEAAIARCFQHYTVARMYADPPYWETYVAKWRGVYGEERVFEWWTNRRSPMAAAIRAFQTALDDRSLQHDGHGDLTRHVGNARRDDLHQVDDKGKALFLIRKERPDSPHKIDGAMASILSREAFNDAIAAGALNEPTFQMFFAGGRR